MRLLAVCWRSLMLAGRMFAAKAPVKLSGGVWRAVTVPIGWGGVLFEQSDDPVRTYRASALLGHDGAGAPLAPSSAHGGGWA
jgi:hypothetical protein